MEGKRYSFSDYFNMGYPSAEIIAELGYQLTVEEINFSQSTKTNTQIVEKLKTFYYQIIPKITLNSENAKREFMIAPLLQAIMLEIDAKLNIEYPITVNERLNGVIDYLIRASEELIVVEAKRGDLDKGFNQLAAEMIALDQHEDNLQSLYLYGAITIGEVWRFSMLNRHEKKVIKDINLFRFPQDTQDILSIFFGILLKE
ncbi:MAG: hypothetical protein AAGD25_21635 [Cyanobacteria bacterium P01_F01_bin.150]